MSLQQGGGKMAPVDSPYTPIVSTAIGSNWCVSARAAYLRRLHPSELFAAVPAFIADLFRRTPAKVSTHVQSQTKLLPPLNGKILQSLSQAPLSFCAVAINLALDTWSAFNNILSQFLLTIGRFQAFWRFRSSGKEAPPLARYGDTYQYTLPNQLAGSLLSPEPSLHPDTARSSTSQRPQLALLWGLHMRDGRGTHMYHI